MNNDTFLAKCKSIDPSVEVDRKKNLEAIQNRILKEEQSAMLKNKKIRRPVVAAAVIAAVLSISAVAYAAMPAIWRHFDTAVVQGEEFVNELVVAEVDIPDGTTSVFFDINIDEEALEAADGAPIVIEVDGEEWVYLDELHFDNLEDGLALLQLDVLLPTYLPEGFSFSRFTFPVNPNNHRYMMGVLPAAQQAIIHYVNEAGDSIVIQIGAVSPDTMLGVSERSQSLTINGKAARLGTGFDGVSSLSVLHNGILYGIWPENDGVTSYDLVRMAESMEAQ